MKILIIRLRSIGDMLLATPAVTLLNRMLPQAEITVLSELGPSAMMENHPGVSSMMILDRGSLKKRAKGLRRFLADLSMASWLRNAGFDLVIDLYGGPRSAAMAWMTKAPLRVGFEKKWRSCFYSHSFPESQGLHTVAINLELTRQAALLAGGGPEGNNWTSKEFPLVLPVTGKALAEAGQLLGDQRDFFLIHAGARFAHTKAWDRNRFVSLISRVSRERGLGPVIIGTGEDTEASEEICNGLAQEGISVLNLCGRADLPTLAALCSKASLFIGNDSGPMHIAASQKCPAVGLFGPSDPVRWGPWSQRGQVVTASLDCSPCSQIQCLTGRECMGMISLEMALEGVSRALDGAESRREK